MLAARPQRLLKCYQDVEVVLQVSKDSKISWISESLCIGWNLRNVCGFVVHCMQPGLFEFVPSSQVAVYV